MYDHNSSLEFIWSGIYNILVIPLEIFRRTEREGLIWIEKLTSPAVGASPLPQANFRVLPETIGGVDVAPLLLWADILQVGDHNWFLG